jgi:hypothetical protein
MTAAKRTEAASLGSLQGTSTTASEWPNILLKVVTASIQLLSFLQDGNQVEGVKI